MVPRTNFGLALRGLLMLAVAMGIGRFAFTPLLPMMRDAGLTLEQGGWLAAANYAGYLAGALAAMAWQVRAVPALRLGLAATVATTMLMGLVHGLPAWYTLRFVAGAASALVLVHASAWSIDRLKQMGAPKLTGVVFAGVGSGIAITGLVCLVLLFAGASADLSWVVLGIVAAIGSALCWPRDETTAAAAAAPLHGKFAWTPSAIRMVACYGALGFGYIIPATYLPAMARDVVASPALFGSVWPIFGMAAALSTLAAVRRPAHWSLRRSWIVSNLVMAAGLVVPAVWPTIGAMALSGLLVGGTFMVITMVGMQEAREAGGAHARAVIAAMTTSFALGQMMGPIVANIVTAWSGTLSTSLIIAAVLLIASSAGLAFDARQRRLVEESP